MAIVSTSRGVILAAMSRECWSTASGPRGAVVGQLQVHAVWGADRSWPRFGTVTRAYGDMAWALVSGATFRRFDSSPVPRRADVLETGDISGD